MNTQVSYTCQFEDPRLYDGNIPSNSGQQWQFMKETCTYSSGMYAPTTSISSSTNIALYGSITAGELLIIVFTFILIVIELTKMLLKALDRIRTKKKFINYSTSEVEIKDEF
jgi:hypothetical protein